MKSRSKFYNLRDAVGGLALTTALLWPYAASALEIDVFASIAGLQCAGSSTDPRFANTIFVRSLSGGVTAGSSGGTSGAPITAQPTPVPLRIAKDFDQCSPLLFKAAGARSTFRACYD
jgi:type VI protein secretion system component Hcp